MQGRLAQIRKATTLQAHFSGERLKATLFYSLIWGGLDDVRADDRFREFRRTGLRIGTQDFENCSDRFTTVLFSPEIQRLQKVSGLVVNIGSIEVWFALCLFKILVIATLL